MSTRRYAQVTPPPALFIWSRVADFHDKVRKVSVLSEVAGLLAYRNRFVGLIYAVLYVIQCERLMATLPLTWTVLPETAPGPSEEREATVSVAWLLWQCLFNAGLHTSYAECAFSEPPTLLHSQRTVCRLPACRLHMCT